MKWKWSWMLLLLQTTLLFAQEDSVTQVKKLTMRGYIKNLENITLDGNFDNAIAGNLIHNRLNVSWTPHLNIRGVLEIRNRIFWGEEIKIIPDYVTQLHNQDEAIHLSRAWIQQQGLILHSTIDRAWLQYGYKRWNLRLGRQRINWGISTLWNPNDIFNTYNFLDFDYEERPGRDAIKATYQLSNMATFEVAHAVTPIGGNSVSAIKYFFNKKGYDVQLNAGIYNKKFTGGLGFAGNLEGNGIKAEMQYFARRDSLKEQINITLETDYVFKNGWYANIGMLMNSAGLKRPLENWNFINFKISAQHLMPTHWNVTATIGKEFSPILSANLTSIYSPGTNLYIQIVSFKYNLANNTDVDFIAQNFMAEQSQSFKSITNRFFIRLKWSF